MTVFGPPNGQPAPEIIAPSRNRANASRIVACVNACAGMEDPAEALRLARAALKRAAYSLKVHGAKDVDVQCAEALRALGGT